MPSDVRSATATPPAASSLRELLHGRIRDQGPIPFDEFMDTVLYHPGLGYYRRPGMTTGPAGDFYTSPDVHPAFGRLIARQIAEIAKHAGSPGDPFRIVELGPGTGRLARDIVVGLAAENPELAARTSLVLVEVGEGLRGAQRSTLESCRGLLSDIEWSSFDALLADPVREPMNGCVVANEFFDALPVHCIERRGDALLRLCVDSDGREFFETWDRPPVEVLEHLERLAEEGVRLHDGQRAEIGSRSMAWIDALGTLFGSRGAGGVIIVDYGHPAKELYGASRSAGTLMCYHAHRANDRPLERIGEQDITAHVDFTSLAKRAAAAGFDVAGPVTQMRFLVALGLPEMLAERSGMDAGALRERLALHSLMSPGGMGEIFKVLLLTRGCVAEELTGAKNPFRGTA